MARIDKLAERYKRYIELPWQKDLAGAQKAIFIVYDKAEERKLRARHDLFALATQETGHGWRVCDLTSTFAQWMAATDYREEYFRYPESLALKLEEDFRHYVAENVRTVLTATEVNDNTVVALFGVASLFGFTHISDLMRDVENAIHGRLVVFFPGDYDNDKYRLLDARDGWNYLAVPINLHMGVFES